jgi:hypothetical protein
LRAEEISLKLNSGYMNVMLVYFDRELVQLDLYCQVMEEAIVKYLRELNESFKAQTAGMSDSAKRQFLMWNGDILQAAEETFPQVLRSSLFVACYSMLEVELDLLCRGLQVEMGLGLSSSDLKGQGIGRSRAYMKKVARVEFPDASSTWDAVSTLATIRNVIVHMRGMLLVDNGPSNAVCKFVQAHPDLASVDDYPRLLLSDRFCPFVIQTLREFASELVLVMDKASKT